MVRRRQAISHGRSHCGPRYLPPYGILRSLCVNLFAMYFKKCKIPFQSLFKIHLKPFPVECKDLFIIRNHNRGRWWPGDGNSQYVSYHGTELGCPKYSGGLGSLGGSWTHTGPTGQKGLHVGQGSYELNSFGRRNTTAKNKARNALITVIASYKRISLTPYTWPKDVTWPSSCLKSSGRRLVIIMCIIIMCSC